MAWQIGLVQRLRLVLAAVVWFWPRPAVAHPDDYIDETFVFQTIDEGETELEGWVEGQQSKAGADLRAVYTLAVEHGFTRHAMADLAAQLVHDGDGVAFGRFRAESRLRFAEEGEWPVDVALSAEYELETTRISHEDATEQVITPRLVLSRDVVPRFNTTLNVDLPIRIAPDAGLSFAYRVGVRYPAQAIVRVGAELRHEVRDHAAEVFPQIWFQPRRDLAIKLGIGIGLTDAAERFTARLAVELEI
jgi:hypothetical protein